MKDIEFLKNVVLEASKLINENKIVKNKGEYGDLVTNFDYEIENFIINKIKENYPEFDIVSEEFNSNKELTKNCFTIDPIDGTVNFAHNLPIWAIQIACIRKSKTCAAVIYFPMFNQMFWADESGSYLNDKKIHVNNKSKEKCLYTVEGNARMKYIMEMCKYNPNYRIFACAALNFAYVACGILGGTIFIHDTLWDYTPGQYLVKQAGGCIYNEKGCHIATNNKDLAMLFKNIVKNTK